MSHLYGKVILWRLFKQKLKLFYRDMSNLLSVLFRKKNNSLNTKWHEVIIFYY